MSNLFNRSVASENADRVINKYTYFVAAHVVFAGVVRYAQPRATQTHAQVFDRAALYDVLGLVEDFALGTTATVGTVVDVGAAHVGDVVSQTRNANGTEVETITQLPRTFVLGVEVGPVGVGQQDGIAPSPTPPALR